MRDVVEMARRAGAVFPLDGSYHTFERREDLEAFADLARADERERIEQAWDKLYGWWEDDTEQGGTHEIRTIQAAC